MTEETLEINNSIDEMSFELVKKLSKDKNISSDDAVVELIKTNLYKALQNPETGLYTESLDSLYSMLDSELRGKKDAILSD